MLAIKERNAKYGQKYRERKAKSAYFDSTIYIFRIDRSNCDNVIQ